MSILYITNQGASIKKESERLIVEIDGKKALEIPVMKTESLLLFGNIQITPQALTLLGDNGVPVSFHYLSGKIKGSFHPYSNKNMDLRFEQYNAMLDKVFAIKLMKKIIEAKADSIITFYTLNRAKNEFITLKQIKKDINSLTEKLTKLSEYNSLLGIEGSLSKIHFGYLSKLFKGEIKFKTRIKHPATDEANALLSLGYSIVTNMINGYVIGSGLDPYIGFLHKPDYNRPSLSLDIVELFRASVVDRFVVSVCNQGIMRKKDFSQEKNEENAVLLTEEGLKKFFKEWDSYLNSLDTKVIDRAERIITNLIKIIREKKINSLE